MDGVRRALIVANLDYRDSKLAALRSPARDAQELVRILGDPEIGDFDADILLNGSESIVSRRVARFFADAKRDDLLLLHFACHGVKDDDGHLYFAASDTEMDNLDPTAVSAEFVNRQMAKSRSRRIVLLLDCCYSGAFGSGMFARGDDGVHLKERFGGRGRVVLTASNAMEYAWEGDTLSGAGQPSVFTTALVEGLETGAADRNGDGLVSIEELYDYVYDRVQEATPNQTPGKWAFDVEGELVIAHSVLTVRVDPAVEQQPERTDEAGAWHRARLPFGLSKRVVVAGVIAAAAVSALFVLNGPEGIISSRKIAFAHSPAQGVPWDLFAVGADGGGLERLTSTPEFREYDPAWSPDGSQIAFVRAASDSAEGDVFVMDSGGGDVLRLTSTPEAERRPAWSPDGSWIAFVQRSTADAPGDISLMKADGQAMRVVASTQESEGSPTWSPDGSRIAFDRSSHGQLGDIYSIRPDGSGEQRLTSTPEIERLPSWSPQGAQITFIKAADSVSTGDVYVMKQNGRGTQRLTSTPEAEDDPVWSPEGSHIAFTRASNLSSPTDIYAMDATGEDVAQVTSTDGDEYQVAW